ncbi:hypothetical protein KBZ14_03545 [Synechococcus sp. HJ21-Hayes]|jgi:hypothetical protein|uniref:hypothetical protein n=1 Tax=unclassified Synechococcus TaxID=2626047 RepID=UPI0020CBED48|nr:MULTISPECIES: hypothetical protein [unclassified Synechococcus]MCP9830774.1 hypothetical protein [Synechococcus sp. JJ3a-Johnson]MCP9851944.1 hypothetical protein [Synechococcus sp. HJ21-Hayes]
MADGINETNQEARGDGRSDGGQAGFRGGRGNREGGGRDGGNREPGGFRIRLSDNEMRAARAVQEAFGLRSTVAALGLSIRTVAQLLEEGKLEELVAQQRAAGGARPQGDRERRGGRPDGRGEGRGERGGSRPNPFARPSRPAAPAAPAAESDAAAAAAEPAEATEPASEVVAEAGNSDA